MFTAALVAIFAMFSTAMAQSGSNYTETVGSVDMIYVKGGTYKRGCTDGDSGCNSDEKPTHNVTLSDYYISKYEITNTQWQAVMGDNTTKNNQPKTNITWYDAVEFTCKLSEKTKKKYRLATDAEFEFAARGGNSSKGTIYSGSGNADDVAWHGGNISKCQRTGFSYGACDVGKLKANELGIYDMSGNVYEWVYDNWDHKYSEAALINPTTVHKHTQKVRRGGSHDQPASESRVSARKIRSIEGKDGSIGLRLVLSNSYPNGMIDPCDIHAPPPTGGPKGFRDTRLITGNDEAWVYDMSEYAGQPMAYVLKIWENGAAKMSMVMTYNGNQMVTDQASGQWYTLNSFSLNIVPNSGSAKKYIYYLIDGETMSMMPEGDMPGRYVRMSASEYSGISKVTAPTINSPKTPEQLAPSGYNIDMSNPPKTGRDQRLIEGPNNAWVQDNVALQAGGTHRYRFDFDSEKDARFVVWDVGAKPNPTSITLAKGEWFTVDNTFLRITAENGNKYDYLYTVTSDGKTYYHISYQVYEIGDFRMFEKVTNDYAKNNAGWFEPTMFPDQGASTYIPPSDNPITPSSSSKGSSSSNSSSSKGGSSSSADGDSSSSGDDDGGETSPLLPQIAMSNQAVQVKNGINLQAVNGVMVEIYGIRGNLINRQNYASGVHPVSFAHLPKGIYVVKVQFSGSSTKILRVPVM
jgi:formylglycine-generating enzyme required for sulfatase activity